MRRLVWLDRNGNAEDTGATPAFYEAARLSPDGNLVAVVLASDIWIYDLRRGSMSRLTHTNDNSRPIWLPNGRELFFASGRTGADQVFRKPVDGSAEAEALTTGETARHPESVSPDGRVLAFHEHSPELGTDILMLSLDGAHEEVPYAQTRFNERVAAFSPNGGWLAFQSDDSGRGEVYVGAYPGSGAKHLVSTEGGRAPRWSADGTKIFYLERNRLMSVTFTFSGEDELHLGVPEPATARPVTFQGNVNAGSVYNPHEDRFLVIESETQSRREISIVVNWTEELKRLVPVE